MQRDQFLSMVENHLRTDPEAAAYIPDYVARGLNASRREALERAADMEIVVALLLAKKYKTSDSQVLGKLRKWNGRSALQWDSTISKLEGL